MSGGSFDYAYFDVEEIAPTVRAMGQYVYDDEDVDAADLDERLDRLADDMEELAPVMREIEWYASGDHGPEAFLEAVDDAIERHECRECGAELGAGYLCDDCDGVEVIDRD